MAHLRFIDKMGGIYFHIYYFNFNLQAQVESLLSTSYIPQKKKRKGRKAKKTSLFDLVNDVILCIILLI